jgi:RsiW-degrading membrane proteinase PrsW (M82 family)
MLALSDQINEPYDYILYACVSALGFAFVENLMYLQYDSLFIIQARGMQAVIGHMCDSAIFAYGMVLARYRYENINPFLAFLLSYLTASTFHGLYDFFLFENSYFAFVILFYFEVSLFTLIINNCLNNSSFFTYDNKPHKHKLELVLSVSLIGILLFQYIVNSFQHGVDEANSSFFASLSYGVMLIPYFIYKLSRLDLVKGYWFGYYEVKDSYKPETPMASFVNMIVGTSIKPSNYVGMKLNFRPGRENNALKSFIPGMIPAIVKERLILKIKQQGMKEYKDPYWFLIETEQPIHFPEGTFSRMIVRFTRKGTDLNHVAEEEARLYLISPELFDSEKEITNVDLVKKGIIRVSVLVEEFN